MITLENWTTPIGKSNYLNTIDFKTLVEKSNEEEPDYGTMIEKGDEEPDFGTMVEKHEEPDFGTMTLEQKLAYNQRRRDQIFG